MISKLRDFKTKKTAKLLKYNFINFAIFLVLIGLIFTPLNSIFATFNPEINYQGKLTNSNNVAVSDGDYNMEFKLYTVSSGGTAIWTETLTTTNKVTVTSGLFSVLLGDVTSLAGIDFNQDLYLGINIGGTATSPSWDGEMSPRKQIASVPSAFEADKLDGLDSTQFLRSDEADTMTASSSSSLLSVVQSGIGNILSLFDGATEVFTVTDGGNVGIGTDNPGSKLHIFGGGGTSVTIEGSSNQMLKMVNRQGSIDGIGSEIAFYSGSTSDYMGGIKLVHNGGTSNSDRDFQLFSGGDASTPGFVLDGNKNVGIGTDNPSAKLDVNGDIYAGPSHQIKIIGSDNGGLTYYAADGTVFKIQTTAHANPITFGIESVEKVRIDSNGNVGIGTTSPTQKLTITEGDIQIDDTTHANQDGIIYKGTDTFIHNFNYGYNGDVTTEGYNTFIGKNAGNLTTGSTATETYQASQNVAVGSNSLHSNTTGYRNTAVGYGSLYTNTSGASNVAIGRGTLYYNTEGGSNVALGRASLYHNTTGSANMAIGYSTLNDNTTGGGNTAIGYRSLTGNTTGNYNIANGHNSLYDLTEGSQNTAIGYNTGRGITTGDNNTILGANVTGLDADLSNNIIIADGEGHQRINVDSSGNVGIGTTAPSEDLHILGSDLKGSLTQQRTTSNAYAATHYFRKIRGNSIVQNGDSVGQLEFEGYDGTAYQNTAMISAEIDGTPNSNDMPGRLIFKTTPDGSTSLVERMRVDSSGKVGIGTDSPQARLHISQDAGSLPSIDTNTGLILSNNDAVGDNTRFSLITGASGYGDISFGDTTNEDSGLIRYDNSNNSLKFMTATGWKMTIDSSGNVGIGTTSPSEKLAVDGKVYATEGFRLPDGYLIDEESDLSGPLAHTQIFVGNSSGVATATSSLTVTDGGYVGIGTTNPSNKLQIENSGSSATARIFASGYDAQLSFGDNTDNWAVGIDQTDSSSFKISGSSVVGGDDKLTITTSGNVGIGTTAPGSKLHVAISGAGQVARFYDSSDNQGLIIKQGLMGDNTAVDNLVTFQSTGNSSGLFAFATGNSERMRITNLGNVGIGTTAPGRTLEVNSGTSDGVANFVSTDAGAFVSFEDNTTTNDTTVKVGAIGDDISLIAGASEKMRIKSSGNVGIGTTNPGAKLDVIGAGRFSDNIYIYEGKKIRSNSYAGNFFMPEIDTITGYSVNNMAMGSIEDMFFSIDSNNNQGTGSNKFVFGMDAEVPEGTNWDTLMVIEDTGNVGIGTTSPSEKLAVDGKVYATEGFRLPDGFLIDEESDLSGPLAHTQIFVGDSSGVATATSSLTVTDGGKVGIGTTNPSANLHVVGDTGDVFKVTNSIGDYVLNGYTWTTPSSHTIQTGGYLNLSTGYVGAGMRFQEGGNTKMIITSGNVGIGTTSPAQKLTISEGDIQIDDTTYANQDGIIYKGSSPFIHNFNYGDNGSVTTAGGNLFIGKNAGNLTMGSGATSVSQASYNTAIGESSLSSNTTGYFNSAIGYNSLYSNTTGFRNSALGYSSLYNNTTGGYNSALGTYAGSYISDGSTENTTGDYNLFLGYNTKALTDGDQNETVIGYNATGLGSNTVVLGNDSVTTTALKGNVGIGIDSPLNELDVNGDIRLKNAGRIYFWHSHDLNYADYKTWNLTTAGDARIGNSNTSTGTFNIQTAGVDRVTILSGGNVGIGTTTPQGLFAVATSTDTSFLMVDSDTGYVGVGTDSPEVGLHIGTGNKSQTSLGSVNDVFISGKLEVDGTTYHDGTVVQKANTEYGFGGTNSNTAIFKPDSTHGQFLLSLGGSYGTQFILAEGVGRTQDFDHIDQTNPTLYIQSATEPDTNNTEWGSLSFIGTGSGGGYFNIENGVGDIILNSNNNVGIGTTSPSEKLAVDGKVYATEGFRLPDGFLIDEESDLGGNVSKVGTPADNQIGVWTGDGTIEGTNDFVITDDGKVGIGTTSPAEALTIEGNIDMGQSGSIMTENGLTIGSDLNITGMATSSQGFAVGSIGVIDSSGNISGDRVDEVVTGRSTYSTLNDRFNAITTNYSSVMSNATVIGESFINSSKVNTSNTTAYYNSQIGTIQNDHDGWVSIPETVYGNARSMGAHLIYGNKLYSATHGYGVKVLDLSTETYTGDYYTGSTPALPYNYWNSLAYDPVRNDIYVTYYSGTYGLVKIDIDGGTVTQYTTSNSDVLKNDFGEAYSNTLYYYDGKVYLFPGQNYMQVFDVVNETFTDYGSSSGLPSDYYYSVEGNGNELHISTRDGFFIWNMDTDTLTKEYDTDTTPGLNPYTDDVYSSSQDPYDSDIVWVATARSWQKLSKTNGWQEFHRTDTDTGVYNYRWNIKRINDQLWMGSYYGHQPFGYLVYDLNAEDYFIIADTGKVTGNAEYTSSYHSKPMYYNGYYYFNNYSRGNVYKTQLIFENSNTFETNTLATSTADFTSAKFDYSGGAGTGNSITWYLTADGGSNWEGPVTPNTMWEFTNTGTDLRAKATMVSGVGTSTPIITGVKIAAFDGATWAGEGSNTVETEVLQARDSSLNGIFGSLDLRLEDIELDVSNAVTDTHTHSQYIVRTGDTMTGELTVTANINANNLLANTGSAYNIGSASTYWLGTYTDNLYLNSTAYFSGATAGTASLTGDLIISGDVGIGTTSPLQTLAVQGTAGTNPFNVASSTGASLFRIDESGNVGIGTTSPSEKLAVDGKVYATEGFRLPDGFLIDEESDLSGPLAHTQIFVGDSSGVATATSSLTVTDEGKVGIGTTAPNEQLEITGNFGLSSTTHANQSGIIYKDGDRFIHDFSYGDNGTITPAGNNLFIGKNAGNLTMGSDSTHTYNASSNTGVGSYSLDALTDGYSNLAFGNSSLGSLTTGCYNTAIGTNSMGGVTTGTWNTALGIDSFRNGSGSFNTTIGRKAIQDVGGSFNTVVGDDSGYFLVDGTSHTAGSNCVLLGAEVRTLGNDSNSIIIGYGAYGIGSNTVVLGNDDITTTALKGDVGIGTTAPSHTLEVNGSFQADAFRTDEVTNHTVFVGDDAGGTGTYSTFVGERAGELNIGNRSNGFGYLSLRNNTGDYSNAIGYSALNSNTGDYSNAMGYFALQGNTGDISNAIGGFALQNNTGKWSNAVGYVSLQYNIGDVANAFGFYSLRFNTGNYSNGFGAYSLVRNTGDYSNAIGYSALQYNDGDYNTAIGDNAFNTWTADTANVKTVSSVDSANNRVTVTGHGFTTAVNLKATTTGTLPTGLDGNAQQWRVIDADTLECKSDSFTDGGSGTLTLTPSVNYSNSTALGYNAEPDASNQVVLGNSNVTEVKSAGSAYFGGGGDSYFGGNVGIGTTSPSEKLAVDGKVYATEGFRLPDGFLIDEESDLSGPLAHTQIFVGDSSGVATATSSLTVTDGGNVGIGTDSPQAKLHIAQDAGGLPSIDTNTGLILSNNDAVGDDTRLSLITGTSGYGEISFGDTTNEDSGLIRYDNSNNSLKFMTATNWRMTIDSSGNVGIGTTSPSEKLEVNGNILSSNFETNTTNLSTLVGIGAGDSLLSDGNYNTALGYQSLYTAASSNYNTAVGYKSLYSNTLGSSNAANGYSSLYSNTTGNYNTANGMQSLYSNTTGYYNTANGTNSLFSNTEGYHNTANGSLSLRLNTTGSHNTANGFQSLYSNTTGNYNTSSGYNSLYDITEGYQNTAIGYNAGRGITTGDYNTILGANVTGLDADLNNNIIIADGEGNRRINVDSSGNVGIGTTSPAYKLDVSGEIISSGALKTRSTGAISNTFSIDNVTTTSDNGAVNFSFDNSGLGFNTYNFNGANSRLAFQNTNDGATGSFFMSYNTFQFAYNNYNVLGLTQSGKVGSLIASTNQNPKWRNLLDDGAGNGYFSGNVGIGTTSPSEKLEVNGNILSSNFETNTTNLSTLVGIGAGNSLLSDGINNTAIGYQSLYTVTSSDYNTAVGYKSLHYNTTGSSNTANGFDSLRSNTTGSYNTANGMQSLYSNTTGYHNTANGMQSLFSNTEGYHNTANGMYSLFSNTTGSHNTSSGYRSLYDVTEGIQNTAIGYNTGGGITTGDYNTILGANVIGLGADLNNNIIIADGQGNQRINVDSSGNVGIGTTSPGSLLTITNSNWISSTNDVDTNYINMFKVNTDDEIDVGGTLNVGSMEFSEDSGFVTAMDMPVSATPTAGDTEAYAFKVDGDNIMTIYAEADGVGGVQNKRVGIGTTTPSQALSVQGSILADAYLEYSPKYVGDALSEIMKIKALPKDKDFKNKIKNKVKDKIKEEVGDSWGVSSQVPHGDENVSLPSDRNMEVVKGDGEVTTSASGSEAAQQDLNFEEGFEDESEVWAEVDHSTLPEGVRYVGKDGFVGRDLGKSVQLNLRAIQQLGEMAKGGAFGGGDVSQAKIAFDDENYAELLVDATGDLAISTIGKDVRLPDDNISICSNGACSVEASLIEGTGNLIVENIAFIEGALGVGTAQPSRGLDIYKTSDNPQMRISYNQENFAEMQVTATGDLSVSTVGKDVRLPDDNMSICSGGACPSSASSIEGSGNLIVENTAFVAGALGVGTPDPTRILDVYEPQSDPQFRISYNDDLYSEFSVSATGDLTISAEGGDISILNENFKVCSDEGCPSIVSEIEDTGNLIVENSLLALGNVGIGGTVSPDYTLDVQGTLRAYGITDASDVRLKTNIQDLSLLHTTQSYTVLENIKKLRGVTFKWKNEKLGKGTQIGMIAQELEKIYPELVSTDNDGFKSIQYGKFTAVLLEAVKELITFKETIEYRSTRLEGVTTELEKENERLKQELLEKTNELKEKDTLLENRIKALENILRE